MNIVDIKAKISDRMKTLPAYLQEAINDSGWEKKIFNIGKKYNLHIDDLDYLEVELAGSLVGVSDQFSFAESLKKTLGLSDEIVDNIIKDINEQIFNGIREKIKEDVNNKTDKGGDITASEKDTLKNAGVGIGEEEDLPVEPQQEKNTSDKKEEEEFVEIPDGLEKEESETGSNSNLNTSIFKTKTSTVEDKNEIKIDPYREPIE